MNKLKVALVGTIRPIFKGDMRGVPKQSIDILKTKSKNLEFDFIPIKRFGDSK